MQTQCSLQLFLQCPHRTNVQMGSNFSGCLTLAYFLLFAFLSCISCVLSPKDHSFITFQSKYFLFILKTIFLPVALFQMPFLITLRWQIYLYLYIAYLVIESIFTQHVFHSFTPTPTLLAPAATCHLPVRTTHSHPAIHPSHSLWELSEYIEY